MASQVLPRGVHPAPSRKRTARRRAESAAKQSQLGEGAFGYPECNGNSKPSERAAA
jgi:hypothetical protein